MVFVLELCVLGVYGAEFALKWVLAGYHLVQDTADSVDIKGEIEGLIRVRIGNLSRPVLPAVLNAFQHEGIHIGPGSLIPEKLSIDDNEPISNFDDIIGPDITINFLLFL